MSQMDVDALHSDLRSPTMERDNDFQDDDPCERCEAKGLSTCCGATIVHHDICSDCGEHCDSFCEECEDRKE